MKEIQIKYWQLFGYLEALKDIEFTRNYAERLFNYYLPQLEKSLSSVLSASSIPDTEELQDKIAGLESELGLLVDQIFTTKDLGELKELTKRNFPDEWNEYEFCAPEDKGG